MCEPVSIGIAGLALSAATTAYTINAQQQAAEQQQNNNDEAAARSRNARIAEQGRQDELRKQRAEVASDNLMATGAEGNAISQGEAEAARQASIQGVPTTVGENVPQIYSTPGAATGSSVTAGVATGLAEARQRLAARARLQAYDDVGAAEARMRKLSSSAFDALQSMSAGSGGVYQNEANIPATTVQPGADAAIAQGGILAGNYAAANSSKISHWLNGTSSPTDRVAELLTQRALNGSTTAPAAIAANNTGVPAGNTPWIGS